MQVYSGTSNSKTVLQLLLFIDQRPSSKQQVNQIRQFLDSLTCNIFELQVIEVSKQPSLAEYFKLVATPALIKIYPEPRQILAGSNLASQLEHWWPRWEAALEEYRTHLETQPDIVNAATSPDLLESVAYVSELIRVSDEAFRLHQEKEQLQQQLNFKDRIIEILAHDLRSPLTAMALALETLESTQNGLREGDVSQITPALRLRLIQQTRHQIRIIDRMITEILQTATGPSARLHLQPNRLELKEFCKDILGELSSQFQAKSLQLQTDIPSDVPAVYADPERIRQVIVNLFDNAIKYTPTKGTIQLSILHRTTQKIQVSICDSGPGIPEENRDRVFQERFRLERDECQDGYGIGLSLCRRIIQAHYGQIWVDSCLGKGSCFHFTLPVYQF
ncbi:MAG: histidine kinase [Oscillatoriales cyanobacterium RM2_1_1]|nr:histidine kinase [Oscillatoriales cyanobacterium SM2_3_0]NJO46539.1 histidine kinase [Oscillatoriales cyanobacterium RM2_1_1]